MKRRAYLYFVLTFLLGVTAGGAGIFFYGWHSGHWHRDFDKQRIVRHLTRKLSLSDPQVRQLNQILDESIKKYSELQKQVEPQFAAVREERRNRIRQILTPEQLPRFNELVRRHEERIKKQGPP